MYEENKTGSIIKDVLLQIILVVIFVFLLLWLFPTKGYVDNKLEEGLDPLYQELFNDHLQSMKEAAQSYYTKSRLPKNVGDTVSITLGEMLDKKLVSSFVDSNNKQCSLTGSYVEITKMDDEYMMKVNLNCSDKSDYIIVYLGCYNYCDDYLCEKQETSTSTGNNNDSNNDDDDDDNGTQTGSKKYKYEYELITNGEYGNWSKWSSWTTNKVTSSDYRDVDTKKVWEVVDTETVKTGTKTTYVDAEKTTKTYAAKKTVQCPNGYTNYNSSNSNSKLCVGRPIKTTGTTTTVANTKQVAATATQVKVCPDGRITTNDWCFATITSQDVQPATPVTTYGNWVYSSRETFTSKQTSTSTTKYEIVSTEVDFDCTDGCKSVSKYTYNIYTRTASTTYNCNKYSGYTLSGTSCVKSTSELTSVYGTWTVQTQYSCPDGSTPVNGMCNITTYSTQTSGGTNKCTYGDYDATSGLCYVRGEFVYTCPYGLDGEIEGTDCVVEKYTCDEGTLVGNKCKIKENVYKTEKEYGYVTYYRYRTREYISGTVSKVWSTSSNDTDLINKGYSLTGNKKEI